MINKTLSLTFLFICFKLVVNAQNHIPTYHGEIIQHKYYTLSYIEKYEQAEWVSYSLSASQLKKVVDRKDDFHEDWYIKSASAAYSDYNNSGYDAGHLCPARQMQFDCIAMNESFFMSNMAPQVPEFNRRAWAFLEKLERNMVWRHKALDIVVGSVFPENPQTIGSNKVAVPSAFYRILYDAKKQEVIAFLLPNKRLLAPLETFVVSVDSIESITGINFLKDLPTELQNRIESQKGAGNWSFENPNLTYGYTLKPYDCSQADILSNSAKININTASKAALMQLPGIGDSKADAIIALRPYKNTKQLTKVKGIGTATYDKLKNLIVL